MGFCKFTKSGRPASVSGDRKSLSLRGAKRRGNPFFSCKETDSHASNAVTGAGMTGSGTSRTPSPTTAHRTHPQGGDAHTSPRRTNAHFAAGHMGPALQGTSVMQDGTSRTPSPTTVHRTHPQGAMPTHCPAGQIRILRRDTWVPPYRVRRSCRTGRRGRRPLQRLTVPVRRGRCPQHPANSTKRQAQAPASLCVMRLFTWRSWRPHDRRGRPSDSAP